MSSQDDEKRVIQPTLSVGRNIFKDVSWPNALLLVPLSLAIYLGLDSISYVHAPQDIEITLWSPMIAWLIILVLIYGIKAAPVTILAPALSEIVLRHAGPFSLQAMAAAGSIGCVYTAAGLTIRRAQRDRLQLSVRWLSLVLIVIVIAALLNALLYSAALILAGSITKSAYLETARISWVGDMNGIVVLLPLFIFGFSGEKPWQASALRSHSVLLACQALALIVAFWFTFYFSDSLRNDPFYLLFLPVIWVALRWGVGLTAIVLGIVQIAIVFLVAPRNSAESFLFVQLLMVVLAGTGLFMGIATSQNATFATVVRAHDNQLAKLNAQMAVSEMHSAIAHELNNPLSALLNYVQSAALLLDRPGSMPASIREIIDKAQNEAVRSVEVLRKLRTFYRIGEVRRETVDAKQLVSEALAGMQAKIHSAGITCSMEVSQFVPTVVADPMQMAMVMQNLLANAIDAVSGLAPRQRKITVCVRQVADNVEIHVIDTGTGMPASLSGQLFRPLFSIKAGGMGLGLAICRALVEANDGRIWLVSSASHGTEVAFSLPAQAN